MPAKRKIRLPTADFPTRNLPAQSIPTLDLFRVHSDSRPAVAPYLNALHRFSHPHAPEGLLYLGEDLNTCLWECFGDEILEPATMVFASRWFHNRLSRVQSTAPLSICDLTRLETRRLIGVDLGALNHTELDVPQAWGLAIQTHPSAVDGIRYPSRFTGDPCLVLFDRGGLQSKLTSHAGELLPKIPEATDFLSMIPFLPLIS